VIWIEVLIVYFWLLLPTPHLCAGYHPIHAEKYQGATKPDAQAEVQTVCIFVSLRDLDITQF